MLKSPVSIRFLDLAMSLRVGENSAMKLSNASWLLFRFGGLYMLHILIVVFCASVMSTARPSQVEKVLMFCILLTWMLLCTYMTRPPFVEHCFVRHWVNIW